MGVCLCTRFAIFTCLKLWFCMFHQFEYESCLVTRETIEQTALIKNNVTTIVIREMHTLGLNTLQLLIMLIL